MLFILRNIRRTLFMKNKVTTYLLYAVGEIFLVMIGIMLAVQIDNWKESIKTEREIESILREIQNDITTDIPSAAEVLEFYGKQDSLINLILDKKLTLEGFKQSNTRLRSLTTAAKHFKIHDNGFKKLMNRSDNLAPDLKPIVDVLNKIYVYEKYEVDKFDERINQLTDANLDRKAQTLSFFHTQFGLILDDDLINYYLTDPFYKNDLLVYRDATLFNYGEWVLQFMNDCQKAYLMIRQHLEDSSPLPIQIAQNNVSPDSASFERFIGTFEIVESRFNVWIGQTAIFEAYEDHLIGYLANDPDGKSEWYFKTNNQIYDVVGSGTITIDPDSSQDSLRLVFKRLHLQSKLLKIK